MARKKDKQKAIAMRKKGMSYSQIKEKLGVGKGTLSSWLENYPLSEERIRQLRDWNPRKIENYRNTMRKKREARLNVIYQKVSKDIGHLSKREMFLAGLFLYWGEGSKSHSSSTILTNTNPAMLKFFIKWLEMLGVKRKDLKVKLHLYSDMNIKEGIKFWSKELKIPIKQFRKTYVKKSSLKSITYKNGFGKRTCCVIFENKPFFNYIIMGLKYISETSNNLRL